MLKTVVVLFRRPHSTGAEPSVGTGDPSLAERDRGSQGPLSWLLSLSTSSSVPLSLPTQCVDAAAPFRSPGLSLQLVDIQDSQHILSFVT